MKPVCAIAVVQEVIFLDISLMIKKKQKMTSFYKNKIYDIQ